MASSQRSGSFDSVRLLAALMVFYSHAYALSGRPEPFLLPGGLTAGHVAVLIFFVMSGYLVAGSALKRSTISFIAARFTRIWPGLFACCAFSIVLGAAITTLSLPAYLSASETHSYLRNAFPFFTEMQADLPGVFQGRPFTAVNGSLWTLRYEVFCYVLLGCAAPFGNRGIAIAAGGLAIFAVTALFGTPVQPGFTLLDYLEVKWIALLGLPFFFGAALNVNRGLNLTALFAISIFAVFVCRHEAVLSEVIAIPLYGSATMLVCRSFNLDAALTRGSDISFGVYIYAFPCQQLFIQLFPSNFQAACTCALVATLTLASLSWHLIERPALKYKDVGGLITLKPLRL